MATREINAQRFSLTSSKPFGEVMQAIDSAIGHPGMSAFVQHITSAKSFADVETVMHRAVGPSGFMEFIRFDLGEILKKDRGDRAPRGVRVVVGNPLIMKQIVERVPDAGSYAPVTILIDERTDGVHLSYDRVASFLASCGNVEASKLARDLDAKVEALLTAAAN
jgi:uncharacterized protein (DUF302 family)